MVQNVFPNCFVRHYCRSGAASSPLVDMDFAISCRSSGASALYPGFVHRLALRPPRAWPSCLRHGRQRGRKP